MTNRDKIKEEFNNKFVAIPDDQFYAGGGNVKEVWSWIDSKLSSTQKEARVEMIEEVQEHMDAWIKGYKTYSEESEKILLTKVTRGLKELLSNLKSSLTNQGEL